MKTLIIIMMIMVYSTTSCGKNSENNLIDITDVSTTENIEEILTVERGQGVVPFFVLINNVLFTPNGCRAPINYDISNAIYIGEITNNCDRYKVPLENLSSNYYDEKTKIYQMNDYEFILELKNLVYNTYIIITPFEEDHIIKLIKIENIIYLFNFLETSILDEYDLSGTKYLGNIENQLQDGYIPTENYTSNFCAEGSKVYRIDEYTIIIQYEKDDKIFYELGEIY